ncbi:glycoside hydrolase family protein [Paradevosia shaoguanensis]|uniref:Lysozyme n=1 Tax=Paradevosia shaoguanensis TaxID=1335043 RepID=A0AA41QRN7_9HYPH|nr:peptidoglycan-binding protein [Paradevosia shaoguanensis]MCF1744639.1 peptidoglycan-binding protein [Paradevosia shaoguanensis]MCI0129122.1 peptidoglycan-binding protein [Paradevosia shaoguanensis]
MPNITRTSEQGIEALGREEGEVLRAYRCPAGVWTIGNGLTKASGVVTPKQGMVITHEESRQLTRLALARNYEPAVAKAMETALQKVFDGAILWHWNTGAIARASWVRLFRAGAFARAEASFKSWNKIGSTISKALTNRRLREWRILEFGDYGTEVKPPSITPPAEVVQRLAKLGYEQVPIVDRIKAFQQDNGLTVDGIVGPATRATLQRVEEARLANRVTVGGAAGGGSVTAAPSAADPSSIDPTTLLWVGGSALAVGLVTWLGFYVWRNRGPLFAWLPETAKDWFEAHGVVLGRRVRT